MTPQVARPRHEPEHGGEFLRRHGRYAAGWLPALGVAHGTADGTGDGTDGTGGGDRDQRQSGPEAPLDGGADRPADAAAAAAAAAPGPLPDGGAAGEDRPALAGGWPQTAETATRGAEGSEHPAVSAQASPSKPKAGAADNEEQEAAQDPKPAQRRGLGIGGSLRGSGLERKHSGMQFNSI